MNIILISPLPPPAGGIASWTQQYLNSQESKMNNVEVVNSAVKGERIKRHSKINLKDELSRVLVMHKNIHNLLISRKYDIIHYNSSCSLLGMIKDYICLRQAKNKVKIVLHYHCDTSYMVQNNISKVVFKRLCNLANIILCLNTSSHDHIKKITKKDSKIIPNFIEPHYNCSDEVKVSEKIRTVIFVGNVIPSKGYKEFLKVAEYYPNINFKLIGNHGNYDDIKSSGNIEFTSEVSHNKVIQELKSADLLLFPSHTEGFPLVVLEAMSCGLPIIATAVGAIPDMIEDKGGILVNVGDVDMMIEAIAELQDKEKRIKMSNWNINKVLDHYTIDHVMGSIFKLYKD